MTELPAWKQRMLLATLQATQNLPAWKVRAYETALTLPTDTMTLGQIAAVLNRSPSAARKILNDLGLTCIRDRTVTMQAFQERNQVRVAQAVRDKKKAATKASS